MSVPLSRRVAYRLLPRFVEAKLRNRYDDPKIGMTHTVELECPETGEMFATEETEPDTYDNHTNKATYECPECGSNHIFRWGPPAPLYVGDVEERDDA